MGRHGGNFNGVEWTPPNQIGSVNDILAILARIAIRRCRFQVANLQAISSADSCLNPFVNTVDCDLRAGCLRGLLRSAGDRQDHRSEQLSIVPIKGIVRILGGRTIRPRGFPRTPEESVYVVHQGAC